MRLYSSSESGSRVRARCLPPAAAAAANDGRCHRRVVQRPRDRHHSGLNLVLATDLAQELDESEVAAQARLVELRGAAAPIILRHSGHPLAVILPVSMPESMGE